MAPLALPLLRLAALAFVLVAPAAQAATSSPTPFPTPPTQTPSPSPSPTATPATPSPTASPEPAPALPPGIPSMKLVWGQSQAWEGTTPLVDGYTASGQTGNGNKVLVFDNAQCAGEPVGTMGVRKNGYWGDTVKVRPDAITPLFAIEVDKDGRRSACPTQPQVSFIHITVRDPASAPLTDATKSPAPTPVLTPTPVLGPLTLFAKSIRCVTAAGAKAKRPLPFAFAASAPSTLTFQVDRSTTKRTQRTCPEAVGRGTGAAFRPIFGGSLKDFTSEPAGVGGVTGKGTIVPPKALGAGLYRLTTTARTADGRTASVTDHFWVLSPKKQRR